MKFITNYKEFDDDAKESVLEHLLKEPIKNKRFILEYLKNGKDDGVLCSGIYYYVKDEPKFDTIHLFTDGEYYWNSEEIYHFEKYNMVLNEEFVDKVLKAL